MTENKPYNLKERTFLYAKRVLFLLKKIKYSQISTVLIGQLSSSATSVGANFEEASESFSSKDFKYKASLAKKEAKESHYWLRLLKEADFIQQKDICEVEVLIQETTELVKILSSMTRR